MPPAHLAEPLTGLLDRLLAVTVALGDDMQSSLAADGLTPARTHLLWELGRTGPCPQRQLAQTLGVTPRNVTGLVDGLTGSGHVTREPHPSDRRASVVTLTPAGEEAVAGLQEGHRLLAELLFADLDPAARLAFGAGLEHVLERLAGATR